MASFAAIISGEKTVQIRAGSFDKIRSEEDLNAHRFGFIFGEGPS